MKFKLIDFFVLLCTGMFWLFLGLAMVRGDFLPVAVMFYSFGIIGGFMISGLFVAIKEKREREMEAGEITKGN